MTPLTKLCRNCGQIKLASEYHKNASAKDKLQSKCKDCNKKTVKSWQKDNPEYWTTQRARAEQIAVQRRARVYGITYDEAQKLMEVKNCEICGVSFDEVKSNIDHDHMTGKVRGVLCGPHNRALGIFNDDIELLKSAIEYLSRNAHH